MTILKNGYSISDEKDDNEDEDENEDECDNNYSVPMAWTLNILF